MRAALTVVSVVAFLSGIIVGTFSVGQASARVSQEADSMQASYAPNSSIECGGEETDPPTGGWAPWAFDEDGYKTYEMSLAQALSAHGFDMPSNVPTGFEVVEDMVMVNYITGSDYTVHVLWQHPDSYATGETLVMYVKHGSPYAGHETGAIWWEDASGIEYELAATDPTVTAVDLQAMACSMASYTGSC